MITPDEIERRFPREDPELGEFPTELKRRSILKNTSKLGDLTPSEIEGIFPREDEVDY